MSLNAEMALSHPKWSMAKFLFYLQKYLSFKKYRRKESRMKIFAIIIFPCENTQVAPNVYFFACTSSV